MRVIAGTAKGVQLQAVPDPGTRPISDRVKAALFDILANQVAVSRMLDLFSGTGSVAIEALSRGADQAVLVEKNPRAIRTIQANLLRTRLLARARVVQADVFRFLSGDVQPFDLIYIAPPQYQELWRRTLLALDGTAGWLAPDGLAVVQIFPKEFSQLPLSGLQLVDQRKYGSTLLCFYAPNRTNGSSEHSPAVLQPDVPATSKPKRAAKTVGKTPTLWYNEARLSW